MASMQFLTQSNGISQHVVYKIPVSLTIDSTNALAQHIPQICGSHILWKVNQNGIAAFKALPYTYIIAASFDRLSKDSKGALISEIAQHLWESIDSNRPAKDGTVFCLSSVLIARNIPLTNCSGYGATTAPTLYLRCVKPMAEALVEFLYMDNIVQNTPQNITDAQALLQLAQDYHFPKLQAFTEMFLASKMTSDTFLDIDAIANQFENQKLLEFCQSEICKKPDLKFAVDDHLFQKLANQGGRNTIQPIAETYSLPKTLDLLAAMTTPSPSPSPSPGKNQMEGKR